MVLMYGNYAKLCWCAGQAPVQQHNHFDCEWCIHRTEQLDIIVCLELIVLVYGMKAVQIWCAVQVAVQQQNRIDCERCLRWTQQLNIIVCLS